jgi:Na+/phosphate symporter
MAKPLPRLTAEALREAILEMCEEAGQMLQFAREGFLQPTVLDKVGPLGRELHLREKRLTDQVAMQLREAPWSLGKAERLAFLPGGLERIGDSVEALARCAQSIHREGVPLSDRAMTEVLTLFSRVADLLKGVTDAIRSGDRAAVLRVREAGEHFQAFSDEIALGHQERLIRGVCIPRASSLFLAMLDYFREIERYTRRMSLELEKALTTNES